MAEGPEIWSWERLKAALDTLRHAEPQALDPKEVPRNLHPLLPYAAWWGLVGEEAARNELVDGAPLDAVRNLCDVERARDRDLSEWLSATSGRQSIERLSFIALIMAADYGKLRLRKSQTELKR
jgi:hypothetical protein